MTLHVQSPGALTTVQDLGRFGWGAAGVSPSGAFDSPALRAANRLAGNGDDSAALEATMTGPELLFADEAVVAIAGAPFDVQIDGEPAAMERAFRVRAGARLRLGSARAGLRCYVAVRGGIDVPVVLGSRSTNVATRLGGKLGRALAAGDPLNVGRIAADPPLRRLAGGTLPPDGSDQTVRVLAGPQEDAFTSRGTQTFYEMAFTVSPRSDRTGVRFEGDPIELASGADLDPEPLVTGAIQVPGDGRPIVLGPDRPATGGYVKIATVIAADLPLVAQARPGTTVRFRRTTLEEARRAWRDRLRALDEGIEILE